jgi:hypothetical protein
MTPPNCSGSPINCRSQSSATSSSSVEAGDVRHSIAFASKAAESISPRMPGPEADVAK